MIDLLPGFALGILDEKESESVLEHLGVCAVCRLELSHYEDITQSLGLAAPLVEPPAGLKQKVLDKARGTIASQSERVPPTQVPSWGSRVSKFVLSWRALAVLLVVVLFSSNVLMWRQISLLKAAPAQTDFGLVRMTGVGAYAGATGVLIVSPNGSDGTLVAAGLKPLDSNHQYQLWLTKDGQRTSGGLFQVSADGYGSLWIYSEQPLDSYAQFGVTIEPSGGSPAPTGEKVLAGKF